MIKSRCVYSIILITILFASFKAFGFDNNNLLSKVQEKYNSSKSLTADFILSLHKAPNQTAKKTSARGKIYLGEGNKFRVELEKNLIVCDGKTFWNFKEKENKVIINNFDPEEPSSFSIKTILNEYPKKCTQEEENGVIILTPKENSGLDFTKAEIWVKDNNLIEKIRIDYPSYGDFEISLSNYRLNEIIPSSKFTFTPPEGSKIIDLR